jgi:uncharacterized protein (UPF0335 family)
MKNRQVTDLELDIKNKEHSRANLEKNKNDLLQQLAKCEKEVTSNNFDEKMMKRYQEDRAKLEGDRYHLD